MHITDKVILITGATGGLGTPVTAILHAAGSRVVVSYGSAASLAKLEKHLQIKSGSLPAIQADVSKTASVEALVQEALRREGRIDALVNLVGGFAGGDPLIGTSEADWEKMQQLNLNAAFRLCKAVLPVMYRQKSGRLVMIAAQPGLRGTAGLSAYAASKAGLINLIQTVAAEGREHGVSANVLVPGIIDTPANRAAMPDADTSSWVKPEAMARVIAFLCSDAGGAVSGSALQLTGVS